MRKAKALLVALVVLVASSSFLLGGVDSQPPAPLVSSPIRLPDDYQPPTAGPIAVPSYAARTTGLKAVAIVGDVGGATSTLRDDMDGAVSALQNHGVAVTKFYYGQSSFTWVDIVAAANGASLLLYMGHGVYSGSMPYPDSVGGFYLGNGRFVTPDEIRDDLGGALAPDSIVIFSHVCFSAGSSAGDPSDLPQSEASRRVRMYAQPFTDMGMAAYFANNYFDSAARTVNLILSDRTMGETFKGGVGYRSSRFVDLSYPKAGYDLWLDGTAGEWDLSFVGLPNYVFQEAPPTSTPTPTPTATPTATPTPSPPVLGNLPDALTFVYSIPDDRLVPATVQLTPSNEGNHEPLTWHVSAEGAWLTVIPLEGTTPGSFQIIPSGFSTSAVTTYRGTVTVTVLEPAGAEGSPHSIDLTLNVVDGSIYDVFLPITLKGHRA
jgi:hypothetical protein